MIRRRPPRRPPSLRPGARIHVCAPSSAVPADRLEAGLSRLQRALPGEYLRAANLGARSGGLAGDDEARLRALQGALADPSIDAIVGAHGGYGLTRLLPRLDPAPLRAAPKVLIGGGEQAALLAWALTQAGLGSIHGPLVSQCATIDDDDLVRLAELARGEDPPALIAESGAVIHGGRVQGRLIVGDLEGLRCLIGTPWLPDLAGCVLAITAIGERPYRVDRALTQLRTCGALRGVAGVIVGQILGCEEPATGNPESPSAAAVIAERLGPLGVPVVTGFAFGDDPERDAALPNGAQVELCADDGALYFLEPATAG